MRKVNNWNYYFYRSLYFIQQDEEKAHFEQIWPSCNSEWSHDAGKRVWCTDKR
jgi:hypothetical protein